MVEDISLYVFILCPDGGIGKGINLHGQTIGAWCQLANHQGHLLVYARVAFKVGFRD